MEGKPHTDKKNITSDWNFDVSCVSASLPVRDLEGFKRLIFVARGLPMLGENAAFAGSPV
jgi:hypothetical protein